MYLIKEAAEISGISVKTLYHYDEIGLLVPQKSFNGYCHYSDQDLDRLQNILYFRHLGFPLKKIKSLLDEEFADQADLLAAQLSLLEKQQEQLTTLILTLRKTIRENNGEIKMTQEEKFRGFDFEAGNQYRAEASKKFGKKVVDDSYVKIKGKEQISMDQMNEVFFGLAENLQNNVPTNDPSSLAWAEKLFKLIKTYAFDATLEAFGGISEMYVQDERFKNNIDQFGPGTAQYAHDVIQEFVNQNK